MRLVELLQAEVALVHDAVIVFVLLILVELGERRGDVVWLGIGDDRQRRGDVVWLGIGDDRQRRSAQVGPGGRPSLIVPLVPACAAAGTKKSSLNGEGRR